MITEKYRNPKFIASGETNVILTLMSVMVIIDITLILQCGLTKLKVITSGGRKEEA